MHPCLLAGAVENSHVPCVLVPQVGKKSQVALQGDVHVRVIIRQYIKNLPRDDCKWGLKGVLSNCQGPIKDTKRTRGRLDRNVAPCSRPITTVIGPLHECKKVCPCTKALPPSGSRA